MRRKVELPGFIRLEIEVCGIKKTLSRDISPQKRERCESRLRKIEAHTRKYTETDKEVKEVVYG